MRKLWGSIWGKIALAVAVVTMAGAVSSCGIGGDQFEQSWVGVTATIVTYNENGAPLDHVHGTSLRITRDTQFDSHDAKGNSNEDSKVLLISIGSSHMHHVGSTLVAYQDGLTDVMAATGSRFDVDNQHGGTPWLNDLKYKFQNYFVGKSQIIVIRSQNGSPIAVFTGNRVQIFSTEVPSSTWYRIDGKMLFVYRADLTSYDSDLLR